MPVTARAQARVLRWAHVLDWQIDRLISARNEVLQSSRRTQASSDHGPVDNYPFHELDAEMHFTMTAARQLLRALRAFDDEDRLEGTLGQHRILTLRDALEHWDEPYGRAWTTARDLGVENPESHAWIEDGGGLLGRLVRDEELQTWARHVYGEVLAIDLWRRAGRT